MGTEMGWFGFPLAVAALAAWGRNWSPRAYWATGGLLAIAFSTLWFAIANVGQSAATPLLIVLFPIVATFWVVSRRVVAQKAIFAIVAALATALSATFMGFVLAVNIGVLRP